MRVMLAALLAAPVLSTACGPVADPPWDGNAACERMDSEPASAALGREVKAEGGTEGFFDSCDYYPRPDGKRALAGLDLYQDDGRARFEEDRRLHARPERRNAYRVENLGVPSYSKITADQATAHALDGDDYLRVSLFVSRYGEPPERARQAAVRVLERAVRR